MCFMQTKHLCVLSHICTKGEFGAVKPVISPPVKYFTDRYKSDILLWTFVLCMSCVFHGFASVHCCLVVTCWERADFLARVCDVYLCFCHLNIWYPWSGMVLDCIDSWSLPPFLLGLIVLF